MLLVEDDPGDVLMTSEAFEDYKLAQPRCRGRDGVEALRLPAPRGRVRRAPRPDLVLLDLNLPRKDGREVLAEVKADPDLRTIPVVVLTTSRRRRTSCAATSCTPTRT